MHVRAAGMVMTPLAQKQATDMYGDTSSEWSSIVNMIQSASNMYMETILRPASKAAAIVLRATKRKCSVQCATHPMPPCTLYAEV